MSVRLNNTTEFSLLHEQRELGVWLSRTLGIACVCAENVENGFPDDSDAPGPTVISTATLQHVADWFPGLTLDEVRRRFRANVEIGGVEPFWEDRLVGAVGTEVPFRIGDVRWLGAKACQRCVVPSRAAHTGEPTASFQKIFAMRREQSLPSWSPRQRFNHFYRLAVNTRLAPHQPAGRLRVGAPVELCSSGIV
jgi:uncharacterized protein YcbX